MTTFKSFDKTTAGQFRKEMNELLAKYGAQSNLVLTIGNISYDGTSIRTKLTVAIRGGETTSTASTTGSAPKTAALERALMEKRMADTFVSPNLGLIRLIDYHPRKPKYPFIGLRSDGKRFKFSLSQVLAGQSPVKLMAARK